MARPTAAAALIAADSFRRPRQRLSTSTALAKMTRVGKAVAAQLPCSLANGGIDADDDQDRQAQPHHQPVGGRFGRAPAENGRENGDGEQDRSGDGGLAA